MNVALSFSRGYLSFQHAQYNAAKFNSTNTMTYHWHAIGFDGPVLPTDRGYEVPDALQKRSDGTYNLGYQTPTASFSLPNVNLANVKTAYLTYDVYWFGSNRTMTATINGANRNAPDPNADGANGNVVALHRAAGRAVRPPQRHEHDQLQTDRLLGPVPDRRQHRPGARPRLIRQSSQFA